MIHPSYVELMRVVNEGAMVGEEPVINSRYSIVCATAKRARQLIDARDARTKNKKALSIAVDELYTGSLKILTEEEAAQEQIKQDAYDEKMREERARRREEEKKSAEAMKAEEGKKAKNSSDVFVDDLDEDEDDDAYEEMPVEEGADEEDSDGE